MAAFVDEYYGERPGAAPLSKMYDQIFVDNLKLEIEHYKKLYRNELITSQALRRKVKNGKRS
jgi:hypothetical protein